ncbi:outer membrane protein assembly factor BamB family protein [Halorientalis salina]|uniref:outer membrane protein assembly factor BamB family protein n=1 Tax=Halorientalis salina TaxID=2932266 RepID=UPI0010ABF447|nr:PQQ-binding-like beta-propeller repeat protein [Halorientalis salina]
MTEHDRADEPVESRRRLSRRGLLGAGLTAAAAGCLRAGSDIQGTATGDGQSNATGQSRGTATPRPGLQSPPTGLTEAWTLETKYAVLRASPDRSAVFAGSRADVSAVEPADGTVRWSLETERVRTRPTVTDETVYVAGSEGTLYALARDDGSVRWTFEGDTGLTTIPIAAPDRDRIVVGAGKSDGVQVGSVGDSEFDPTYVYGLDTDGNRVWTVETEDGNPVTGTAVHDDVVWVRTTNRIDTYDVDDGTERDASVGVHDVQWDSLNPMQSTYYSNRVAADDEGVHLLTQDYVASVSHDGSHRWTFEPFDQSLRFQHRPGTVYCSAADNAVYAVDTADGTQQWRVQLDGWSTAVLLADGYLWSSDQTGTVTAIDAASGEVAFSETVGESISDGVTADVAVAGRWLVYSSPNGITGFEIRTA